MTKRIVLVSLAVLVTLLLLYLLFWPVPIDPAAWTPPEVPELKGIYQPNSLLASADRLGEGAGIGPEDVAVDSQGWIYGGMEDGRIIGIVTRTDCRSTFSVMDSSVKANWAASV